MLGDAAGSAVTDPRRSRLEARMRCSRSRVEPLGSSRGPQSWSPGARQHTTGEELGVDSFTG
eukprot:8166493-Alexandrium_andersonii.AAC.1